MTDGMNRAMRAICDDCDNLDGWGFTRVGDMVLAVAAEFDGDYQRAGGYIKALMDARKIDVYSLDCDEVWVDPDTFAEFC